MHKEKLVLVGNGMAGVWTLEELLKLAPRMYDITVFGAEPHPNCNRIMLSPVLAGEKTVDDIVLNDRDWYRDEDPSPNNGPQHCADEPRGVGPCRSLQFDTFTIEYRLWSMS